jgi:hypothetical protein
MSALGRPSRVSPRTMYAADAPSLPVSGLERFTDPDSVLADDRP